MSFIGIPELLINAEEELEKWGPSSKYEAFDVWNDDFGKPNGYGYLKESSYNIYWPGFAHFQIDPVNQKIIVHAPPSQGHELINDIYQRIALPIYLNLSGYEVLHASAIHTSAGVVGFCAQAGTGKSSTVYGLSRFGYQIWADDALVLKNSPVVIKTFRIPFQVRLFPDTGDELLKLKISEETFVNIRTNLSAAKSSTQAVLAGLYMLERQPPDRQQPIVSVKKLGPEEAFPIIFKHAFVYKANLQENKRELINNYLDIISRIPIFQVSFSTSLAEFDQYIQFLINHLLVEF